MLDRLHALETFGIKLGLENIRRLCAALGHPERTFSALHVAGTNGKGSVTAFAHAALVAAGVRAARYTSPHLIALRERFVVGHEPVDDDALHDAGTLVLDTADRMLAQGELAAPPTFFEATTAIAFELFRRAAIEVAVIEVGLGGRFDATNVLQPSATAITSIAFDHQEHLGDTLRAIAFEKAGIVKAGIAVITGNLPAEADAVVAAVAREQQALLVRARDDVHVDARMSNGLTSLTLRTPAAEYGPVTLALRGEHQIVNALVAVRLLEAARASGIDVPREAIVAGLASANWPARLELVELDSGERLLIDAAHNVEGARALAAYLARWHPERPAIVIGAMADKDVDGILGELVPVTSALVATAVRTRRAMPPDEIVQRARRIDPLRATETVAEPVAAVRRALELGGGFACVAGSIYLVGAVRGALKVRAILH